MNPSFTIQSKDNLPHQSRLVIEISLWGISYVVISEDNICMTLICYHYPADSVLDKAAIFIKQSVADHPILQKKFSKITIIYAFPTAMLVPIQLINSVNTKEILELQQGDVSDAYIRSDFNYKEGIQTIYAVPKQIDAVLSYLFSADISMHQYGLLPTIGTFKKQHLYCIFGIGQFTAMLFKEGKLQCLQSYTFKVPEDITFFMLQLCESFGIPADDVELQLNGMIDQKSNLYEELHNYFLQIKFGTLPGNFTYPEDFNQYPDHYFSYLFEMIACV